MTRPSFMSFSYDRSEGKQPQAKIFLRSLLYSTGKRGHVVENMFLVVRRGLEKQTFDIWGHGDIDNKLARGSGLFVGETGVSANHHFNSMSALPQNFFTSGNYELDVFLELVGQDKPHHIMALKMIVPINADWEMKNPDAAVWFDWEPETKNYHAHVEVKA